MGQGTTGTTFREYIQCLHCHKSLFSYGENTLGLLEVDKDSQRNQTSRWQI